MFYRARVDEWAGAWSKSIDQARSEVIDVACARRPRPLHAAIEEAEVVSTESGALLFSPEWIERHGKAVRP